MATAHTIYLCKDDVYDLSRWLELRLEPTGDVSLTIANGQYPPGLTFTTPIRHLQVVADGLTYHVSEHGNYCAFRPSDDAVEIEYATIADETPERCSVKLEDFRQALNHLYPGVAFPSGPTLF